MDYKKYTDGIIFIDDEESEVDDAIKYFNNNDIKTLFFNPLDVAANSSCLGYNFVFLDLSYNGSVDIKSAVVALKRIAEHGEKHFVVIAWTQHQEEIEKLKEEISAKMADCFPLSILNGEKFKIFNREKSSDFDNEFIKILNKLETENRVLFKLLEWKKNMVSSVNESFDQLIEESCTGDFINLDKKLGILANKTLSSKSMMSALNMLNQKVNDLAINKINTMQDLELEYDESSITDVEKWKYNNDWLFSKSIIDAEIPGSIYKFGRPTTPKCLQKSFKIKDSLKRTLNCNETLYENAKKNDVTFDRIIQIAVDITPNCTYVKKKNNNTTFLCGIIVENLKKNDDELLTNKEINKLYDSREENKVSYRYINSNNEICLMIIFFEKCTYKINKTQKILLLNNNVKVDIQHSFGAWVSRVGNTLY